MLAISRTTWSRKGAVMVLESSRQEALFCVFEDNEAVIKWSFKEGVLQCDMFPRLTELLLIGCLIELIWTPRSESNTLTPTRRHTVQGKLHTWWMESSFVFVQHQPFQLPIVLKRCRKERKKMQVKKESQQNKSRWWIWSHDTAQGIRTCLPRLHRKTGENQIWKSERTSELVEWAANKNRETCDGRLLMKLLRVEWWQELVFSRVEIWCGDGSKNGETCKFTATRFVRRAHGQIYCRWWWHGLQHRHRR